MSAVQLPYGKVVSAAVLQLETEVAQGAVAGNPVIGHLSLEDEPSLSIGVWEITPGTVTDIEVDEVFVVLEGDGTVDVEADDRHDATSFTLKAGDVVRLSAGMRTTWTIRRTLRKVYFLTPAPGPSSRR